MKALIIENEYEVDLQIQAFVKDHSDLFSEVEEHIASLHCDLEDIVPYILESDAILVASTWQYKDQLIEFTKAFASGKLGEKKFYITRFCRDLNRWNEKDEFGFYKRNYIWPQTLEEIMPMFVKLIQEQEVYSIESDYDSEYLSDGLDPLCRGGNNNRRPTIYHRISYNEEHDEFHINEK